MGTFWAIPTVLKSNVPRDDGNQNCPIAMQVGSSCSLFRVAILMNFLFLSSMSDSHYCKRRLLLGQDGQGECVITARQGTEAASPRSLRQAQTTNSSYLQARLRDETQCYVEMFVRQLGLVHRRARVHTQKMCTPRHPAWTLFGHTQRWLRCVSRYGIELRVQGRLWEGYPICHLPIRSNWTGFPWLHCFWGIEAIQNERWNHQGWAGAIQQRFVHSQG